MDDLISRQAAIDAINKCTEYYVNNLPPMVYKADAYKALADLPAVDAVPVIRCKDCKYWDTFPSSSIAPEFHKCKGLGVHTVANFFCKKGERKADE